MLGPWVLASQTCGLFWLYDVGRFKVHGPGVFSIICRFCYLRGFFLPSEQSSPREGHQLPLRKFRPKCSNAFPPRPAPAINECSRVFSPGNDEPGFRAGVRPK